MREAEDRRSSWQKRLS